MRAGMILAAFAGTLLLAACESPEVKRSRGGDRGADLGYRGDTVEMHAGSQPYYRTPQLIAPQPAASRAKTESR